MFLNTLLRRNPKFVEAAIMLHQNGKIPANAYVLDLDAIEHNASIFQNEASKYGLKTFAMTKQVGRHSGFCHAIMRGGITRSVAVDMACAIACDRTGLKTGHLGHLVQIPKSETLYAAKYLEPDYWTVFSYEKAHEAASASAQSDRNQCLMARIQTEGDIFYHGHEGGFSSDEIVNVADYFDSLTGARFAGITTFPALLYDHKCRKVLPTPNLSTLNRAAKALAKAGRKDIEINAPGTTSSIVLSSLAEAGATQVEPGNGLHGTTPLHAVEDLPENPAVLYLSEVSHIHNDKAYCFGGGLYIDPVFPDYQVQAVVASEPTHDSKALRNVDIPAPSAIDYYGMIEATASPKPCVGDSVIFGFRGQAFVTRALVTGITGIDSGEPKVESIENGFGDPIKWPTK